MSDSVVEVLLFMNTSDFMWQLLLSKQLFGEVIVKCIIVFLLALCEFQWRLCSQQFLHNVSLNVNIGGCVCLSGCLKCIYKKEFRNECIWLLSKPHYSHVSGQYFMIISSLRKKMLSYISSVHLWPVYQSTRDFWVRGFWKNLRLGINPEHSCIKTKNVLIHVHSNVKGSSRLHLYNDLLTASSARCILKKKKD